MKGGAQIAGLGLLLLLPLSQLHGQNRAPAAGRPSAAPPAQGFRPAHPIAGAHLPQWFAQHQNLKPEQQADALRREPGFARLPPTQQNQVLDRLHRLDSLPPAKRQRVMERNERFEALPADRREEIRAASQALRQMAPDRRTALGAAFRDLRNMPPSAREAALGSARFQAEYTPGERGMLSNLLSIEPYHAPQE